MKLKVCGLNNPENIKEVCSLNPDYIGFIFYDKSERFVKNNISYQDISSISSNIKKVGVFVNENIDVVMLLARQYNLDYVQLHGNESSSYCGRLFLKQFSVIKSFAVDSNFDFRSLDEYSPFCSFFLFDTKGDKYGGNGMKFNWKLLESYYLRVPLFLSGGITPSDAELIKKIDSNMIYAIDINSKFEISPGIKDVDSIQQFKNDLKGAELCK